MTNDTQYLGIAKQKYFSFEERQMLEKMNNDHMKARTMARILGKSHSTILFELKRKHPLDIYKALYAHKDFLFKQMNKWNVKKLDKDPRLREIVTKCLQKDWSPEEISKRIKRFWYCVKLENNISTETIYSFVYGDIKAKEDKLYLHLRRSRKHRKKRWMRHSKDKINIPERTSIHERPEYINKRKEFWHFETDSVLFSKQRSILSVQVDRKARLTRLTKLPDKTAQSTAIALRSLAYEFWEKNELFSVTFDNWWENVLHTELIHDFWVTTFFADSYCSRQKWTVENMNMLIRQYLPRHIDFESLTDDDIYEIQEKLNNRPRKCLNWLSPNEYYTLLTNTDFTITDFF